MDLAGGCLYASVFVSVACAHMCVHCEVGKRIQSRGSFSFGQTDSQHRIPVISCLEFPDES